MLPIQLYAIVRKVRELTKGQSELLTKLLKTTGVRDTLEYKSLSAYVRTLDIKSDKRKKQSLTLIHAKRRGISTEDELSWEKQQQKIVFKSDPNPQNCTRNLLGESSVA
jgi:hypothetical protein